jgi:hypothetical protein
MAMTCRMLLGAILAAMLSVAASGGASSKATAALTAPEVPLPTGGVGPDPVMDAQDLPERGFKTAFTLIMPLCPDGPSNTSKGCMARKPKGFTGTQQGAQGKQPASTAQRRNR